MKINDCSVVIIGHVDAGKSSLTGQILLESGAIDARVVDKLKATADSMNRSSFYLAHMTDTNLDEQKRGITIVAATKKLRTLGSGREITIVDAPGHRQFLNNMITGASQCNYAVLVVSGKQNEMVAGLAANGQTMEHVMLVSALGCKRLVIAVNKMDDLNYSQQKYEEVCGEVLKQYKKLPIPKPKDANGKTIYPVFVPISGFKGCNVTNCASDKMPWYTGPTLMDVVDAFPPIEYDLTTPMRMVVSNEHSIKGAGTVFTGKVLSGLIKVFDMVDIMPCEATAQIKTIGKFKKSYEIAYPDDSIGISLKGLKEEKLKQIKKGAVIGSQNSGMKKCYRFKAEIIFNSAVAKEIKVGFKPVLSTGTARVSVTLVEIHAVKSLKAGSKVEKRDYIKKEEKASVSFQTENGELCVEDDKRFELLTRAVLRNSNQTIGFGKIAKIENDKFIKGFRVIRTKQEEGEDGDKEKGSKKKK